MNEPGDSLCRESRVPSIAVTHKWEGSPLVVPSGISLFSCSAVNDLSMIVGHSSGPDERLIETETHQIHYFVD